MNSILKTSAFLSQNPQIFEEWKKRLFNRRPYKLHDRICERHFTKDQILTHWDHIIDGKLVQLGREKPRLKDSAIPQLNLEVRLSHTKRTRAQTTKKSKMIHEKPETITDDRLEETDESNDGDHEIHSEMNSTSDEEVVNVTIEKLTPLGAAADVESEGNGDNGDANTKQKIFETIYDDIYEVVLPNTLWGIHRDPDQKFIAFTQFDSVKMNCGKLLLVSNTFRIRAFVGGVEVSKEAVNALSVESISKALCELDEQQNGT